MGTWNNYYIPDTIFALLLILGLRNVQFCVICSLASTRGLRRISFAIPLSSIEISTFVETATHKAVKIQEELSLLLTLYPPRVPIGTLKFLHRDP